MNGCHHLGGRVEGVLNDLRTCVQELTSLKSRKPSCTQECKLHGITGVLVGHATERCITAKHRNLKKSHKLSTLNRMDLARFVRSLKSNLSDREFSRRKPHPPDRHAVFGEGSSLVGEDHRRGTEGLNCREALDQRILSRHAPHTACECERCHDRQPFRDRRDRKCNCGLDHEERVLALRQSNSTNQRGQDERHPHKLTRKSHQLLLKR